jgi:hypothetical protein
VNPFSIQMIKLMPSTCFAAAKRYLRSRAITRDHGDYGDSTCLVLRVAAEGWQGPEPALRRRR